MPSGVDAIPFVQDSLVAICAKKHPLAQRKAATLEVMGPLPFVDLTPERALRAIVDRSCAAHGLRRKTMFEVSAVETMLQFVGAGLGVSIVPFALAKASEASLGLHILPFRDQGFRLPKWKVAILIRPQRRKLAGQTVLNLMLEALTHTSKDTAKTRYGQWLAIHPC